MTDHLSDKLSELQKRYQKGNMSRRDFLRAALTLTASLGAGGLFSACSTQPDGSSIPFFDRNIFEFSNDDPTMVPDPNWYKPAPTFTPEPEVEWINKPGPTSTPVPGSPEWYCEACGERFRSRDLFLFHAAEKHTWRLPRVQRVDRPTYEQFIVEPLARFDERNTALSRRAWDKKYQAQMKQAATKAPKMDLKRMEGEALLAGAIYVDDTVGSLNPTYYGYNGHQQEGGGLYSWEETPNPERYPVDDPVKITQHIKEVARFYGADLVGITRVDPRWVYSHFFEATTGNSGELNIPYRFAIVMGIEMDWGLINESPQLEASAAAALGYSRMAELTASLAKYIRMLGYPAVPSGNDSAQSIPLAIDAGLGELGRNGLLITPEFGPRQRLCKVFTDLPLEIDQPIDFGMQKFCETCHACSTSCPVSAIQSGDRTTDITSISNRKGLLRWPVDTAACQLFWVENGTDCGNCVAACPWAIRNPRDWLEFSR